MTQEAEEFRTKLVDEIALADSPEAVEILVSTAMRTLKKNNVNGHLVVRNLDRILDELHSRSRSVASKEWLNVNQARVEFFHLKEVIKGVVH